MKQLAIFILFLNSALAFSAQQVIYHLKEAPNNFLVHMLQRRMREGIWDGFKQYERCLPIHLQYKHFEALRNSCKMHQHAITIAATLRAQPSIATNLQQLQQELNKQMPVTLGELAMPDPQCADYVPQLNRFVQEKLKNMVKRLHMQEEADINRMDALHLLELTGTPLWSHVYAIQKTTESMSESEMRVYLGVQKSKAAETDNLLKKIKDDTYIVESTPDGRGARITKRSERLEKFLEYFWKEYIAAGNKETCNDPACKERKEEGQ